MQTLQSNKISQVRGVPVLGKRIMTDRDPIFDGLTSLQDYCNVARQLRGPFAIIVREGPVTTVVTDFGACLPVYYAKNSNTQKYDVEFDITALSLHANRRISVWALFRYISWTEGVIEPLYAGVARAPAGVVLRFAADRIQTVPYINWDSFAEEDGRITEPEAKERFFEITDGYLRPLVAQGGVACLLSGGTDSAVVASALKRVSPDISCLTADYFFRRYSEWSLSRESAQRLKLRQYRVPVRRSDHRRIFQAINSRKGQVPCSFRVITPLARLAEYALEHEIKYVFTGDNSGPIFLEYHHYFQGLPTSTTGCEARMAQMTMQEKLERLVGSSPLNPESRSLIYAFGCTPGQYEQWEAQQRASRYQFLSAYAETMSWPKLLTVTSQIEAGVPQQNQWLPTEAAAEGIDLLSPFLDIEMIRFAISLPFRLKFNDGTTKYLLRSMLKSELGIELPKIASFTPDRLWNLVPRFDDLASVDPRLRSQVRERLVRNFLTGGRLHAPMLYVKALGMWLLAHDLGEVATDTMPLEADLSVRTRNG